MIALLLIIFSTVFCLFLLKKKKKKEGHRLPPSPKALPVIGHLHLIGPLIHHSFNNLSARYGPLVYLKLGFVSCVVASTPEVAKQFLKTHDLTFSARKHSLAIDQLTYNNSSFAFAPYGPYWKFIKKFSTFELLGNRMLNQFLPIRTKELQNFLGGVYTKSKHGTSVNVSQELMKLSNNVISQMMWGNRSSEEDDKAELARNLVREVTQIFGEFNVSDIISFCKNLDLQGFKKRIEHIRKRYDTLLEKIITEHEEERKKNQRSGDEEQEARNFLDMLLDAMEDQKSDIKLTRNHIKALVLDFFTAATDTTAISIEWALAELINHPTVLDKAREEIEIVVGKHRLVQESDSPNLPYIQAIIKETFRLHPPIPMVTRQSVQECNIDGYTIPAHTLLFVNNWAIGRDPKYWENPLEFEPERFLKCSVDIKGQHFELLPFGTGRRSCPGMPLAMKEVPTTLAAMIQCFDWKVDQGGVLDMSKRPGLTAPRAHDLVCTAEPRFPQLNINLLHP